MPNDNQVLAGAIGAQEAIETALGIYHMAVDKQLATMAGYRALGLDPRDVPTFAPLLAPQHKPTVSVNQQVTDMGPSKVWGTLGKIIGLGIVPGLATVGLLYAGMQLKPDPPTPATPTNTRPVDIEVRWKVIDGKVSTEVVPVEPGK